MFSSLYFRLIWLFTSASLLPNTFVLSSDKELFVFCKLVIFLFMFDDGFEYQVTHKKGLLFDQA